MELILRSKAGDPPVAIFTKPDEFGVRREFVNKSLKPSAKAWVRTGKFPGENSYATFWTILYTIQGWFFR